MEMFEKREAAEAENLILRLLFFERFMCWLVQVGASVRYSKYYARLLQRALLAFSPTCSEADRVEDLARLRSELLMRDECPYVVPNLRQPITEVYMIEETWQDPRRDEHGARSDQPYVFESHGMAELYDHIADVGLNGPGERIPGGDEPPDRSFTSRVLEGDELDAFVLEQGVDPRDVFGATVPLPPPTPTPLPSPSVVSDSAMEVDGETIPVPPASPPRPSIKIKIPLRKRPRARVDSATDEEDPRPPPRRESAHSAARMRPQPPIHQTPRGRAPASSLRRSRRRSSPPSARRQYWSPPSARRPPEVLRSRSPPRKRARRSPSSRRPPAPPRGPRNVQIPIPGAAPRLRHDTSVAPSLFEHEGHRAVGAVVRQLVPGCKRCGSGLFCTDDTDPNQPIPKKPRRTCLRCFNAHETCEAWGAFYAAYSAEDGEALDRFVFEYWEHLGNGMYQLLTPDDRLSDLLAIAREYPYRAFLYSFLPLQNTQRSFRRRGDVVRHPAAARVPSPASRSSSASRDGSPSPPSSSPSPNQSVLGDNPLDYDLEEEPAPPPPQQASSSRLSPPRAPQASSSRAPPSRPAGVSTRADSPSRFEGIRSSNPLSTLADLLLHSQEEFTANTISQDAEHLSAFLDSHPGFDREQFVTYMQGVLDRVSQEENAGESASKTDRKGKSRAK
ncbi:hypothetical protein DFH06DRAFT_1196087 [Mycena polygramma]|nr:hypothetical protein DFH06DRAFT_1196087 [Mycena polygramma]